MTLCRTMSQADICSSRRNSALLFQLPQTFAEAGLLPVHGPELFQHAALRVVDALHDRSQNMHVVAQAGHFGRQALQRPTEIGWIDNRLASLVAQRGISFTELCQISRTPGKLREIVPDERTRSPRSQ